MPAHRIALISLGLAGVSLISAPLAAEQNVEAQLKAAAAAACIDTRTRHELADGARISVERFAPGGGLRRVVIVYHAPAERARRPEWMVIADGECRILQGRHLVYDGSGAPAFIERTDASLAEAEAREPLNPPVPEGGTCDCRKSAAPPGI